MKSHKIYQIVDDNGKIFEWKKINHPKFKYELTKAYQFQLWFTVGKKIDSDFYDSSKDGLLLIKAGYRWDGASGPTLDTVSTMRASCVHDVGYQMMRREELSQDYRNKFDHELKNIMIQDYKPSWIGGELWSKFRAGYYYHAVGLFGGSSCRPD